ncbi:hypothetical protein [Nonomuraea endophytica]|uniref:Uncharacterized protein n=1 Tax=Nonomuraea endophytica TaxID=714136 RepID=A0A7W8A1K1_9ACTN|nr:hypothetical protein [Nonomuraea endophytica]MBB5077833.1 hypothetical protein [Nonomuraea endophytica]
MSNGARHGLGVLAGLLLAPLLVVVLSFGLDGFNYAMRTFTPPWIGLAIMAGAGVLVAFMFSSRISPVATVIGGLIYTVVGLFPILEMSLKVRLLPDFLPSTFSRGLMTLMYTGILLTLGVGMLVASCFPSRWRGARRAVPAHAARGTAAYGPGGYQPAPGPEQTYQQPPAFQPPERQPSAFQPQEQQPSAFQRPPGQEPGSVFQPQQPTGGEDATRPMHRE